MIHRNLFLLVALAATLVSGCNGFAQKSESGLVGFTLHYKMETGLSPEGLMLWRNDSIVIYTYENLTLYQIRRPWDSLELVDQSQSDSLIWKLVASGVRLTYFIWAAGEKFGREFDSPGASNFRSYPVDSMKHAVLTIDGNRLISGEDSLVARRTIEKGWEEIYVPRFKPDLSYPDSSLLQFTHQMADVQYSLSPLLDSARRAKLTRILFVYNPMPDPRSGRMIPRRELLFEMLPPPASGREKIIQFFRQFEAGRNSNPG